MTDNTEADNKSEKFHGIIRKIIPQTSIGINMHFIVVRNLYDNYQKRDANSKNGITKKNKPFYLKFCSGRIVSWMIHK
jgi:hypothetical protein